MPKRNIRNGPRNLLLQRRKGKANVPNWHYTLNFYPEESPETENKGDKGWRKLALTGIWDVIRKTAYHFTTEDDYDSWPTWETDVIDLSRQPESPSESITT